MFELDGRTDSRRQTSPRAGYGALAVAGTVALFALLPAAAQAARVGAAGPDRAAVVGATVRIGTGPSRLPGGRGRATIRWRIVKRPRGSRARVIGPHGASPQFRASTNGHYVLGLTVRRAGRTFTDDVRVSVRPDDPPIGVSLRTLSDDPRGGIQIDGQPVPDTFDRSGIFVAVLERDTRRIAQYGTTPRDTAGLDKLIGIAKRFTGTHGYIMIVSAARGIDPNRGGAASLDRLAESMGARKFTASEEANLRGGGVFSIVGIPGSPSGSAWANVATPTTSGEITGYLQFNTTIGLAGLYDYVSPERPTFDTQALGAVQGSNGIKVGGKLYTAALPNAVSDGFQVLALDSYTLQPIGQAAVPTNGADAAAKQAAFAQQLTDLATPVANRRAPLIILQSIGHPKGASPGWARAADVVERLGGTRLVFNALDGAREYALVGSLDAGGFVAESRVANGGSRTVGGLARTHDFGFKPTVSGPPGGVNTDLIDMTYQAPAPFPAFDTVGKRNAETYIGKAIHLCTADATECLIRPLYYKDRAQQLKNALDELRSSRLDYPGDGHGFDKDHDYDPVRKQLTAELEAVARVREYFAALRVPFDKASLPGRVNLKDIGKQIEDAVDPPRASNTTSRGLELASKISGLLGALPQPAGNVGKVISTSLGLAAFFTRSDGSPVIGDEVKIKAGELAEKFQQQMFDASRSTIGLEYLFVSDYGKLTAIDRRLPSDEWKLQGDDASLNAMTLAARRWYAEQLVPVAYPWLVRGTPPPLGPGDANGLSCDDNPRSWGGDHPWSSEPANAQIRAIEGWNGDGTPFLPTYFFSRIIFEPGGNSPSPAQSVADLLFNPVQADPTTGPLGMDRLEVLSPRVFHNPDFLGNSHKLYYANDTADVCDLVHQYFRFPGSSGSTRARLQALRLRPPALFPAALPSRLADATSVLVGKDHYTVFWTRHRHGQGPTGYFKLTRGSPTQLSGYLATSRRLRVRPRRQRVGSRDRWYVCAPLCGYAWTQTGRTYGVFGDYKGTGAKTALLADERALIRRLHPI